MINFKEYDEYYFKQVVDLQEFLWGGDEEIRRKYLQWKVIENPFTQGYTNAFVAVVNHKVIAFRNFVEYKINLNNEEEISLYIPSDAVIHPDFRGKGIFSELNTFAMENIIKRDEKFGKKGIFLSLSSVLRTSRIYLKYGFQKIGIKKTFIKLYFPTRIFKVPISKHQYQIRELSQSEFLKLIENKNISYFKSKFYEWKFKNPRVKYKIIGVRQGQSLYAFSIFAVRKRNRRDEVVLIDFGNLIDYDEFPLNFLIRNANILVKTNLVKTFLYQGISTRQYHNILRESGFLDISNIKKFLRKPLLPLLAYSPCFSQKRMLQILKKLNLKPIFSDEF